MIKIDFEFDTEHGVFRDALHLPEDHKYSDTEIQVMKEQRRDNWIAHVTAPPIEAPVEEVQTIPETVVIGDETYQKLEGTPVSGAKLVEANGVWYYKV